jgi:ornithine carbamoyltransferase
MPTLTAPAPTTPAAPLRNFLTLDQLGSDGLRALLDLTGRMKRDPAPFRNSLAGGRLGMLFDKPSTRTRVSFEAAAWMLGMLPIVLRPEELQIGRGETVADTGRTLSLYLSALAVRTFSQASLEELTAASSIPVINALTNEHHPCQAVADAMTLEESVGTLAGISVAFVGDGDNVCHSLMQAAALAGFELRVATPPGYEPSPEITAEANRSALATGGRIVLMNDPAEAVNGVDAVYTDVWTSMGKESEQAARKAMFAAFTVDARLMRHASPRAIFLHCLPAHRGEEVTAEVIDGPASRVWPQAENRMHTEAALLYTLLRGGPTGERAP